MAPRPPSRRVVALCPVLPDPPIGGGHKRTLRLLEAIEQAGGEPHVISTNGGDPESFEAIRARGWGVDAFEEPPATLGRRVGQHVRGLPSPYVPAVATRLEELIAEGCAAVQVEQTQSAYYHDAFSGVPWVLSLHNVDSQLARSIARAQRPLSRRWAAAWNRWRSVRAVEKRAVPRADAVLCVSEADGLALAALARRVVLVANGVDDDFFAVPEDPPARERVLFFGQYDYPPNATGIARFLKEGWPLVAARRPEARLVLAGRGMAPALRELAEASPSVDVVGFVPDLADELARSRIVVVPIWEGGGTRLKVLEALASARPVVGTGLGVEGIGVEHDRHALIAEDSAGLAAHVVELLANGSRARALAVEGRRLAERYSWRLTTRPLVDLYEAIVGAPALNQSQSRSA